MTPQQRYVGRHPERARASKKAYYLRNRDKILSYQRAYRSANADRIKTRHLPYIRARNRVRAGVLPAHANLVAPPDTRCEACGILENRSSPLVLDHDHASGAFRGWLCGPCNKTIGVAYEDPDRLRACAEYVCTKR